MSTAIISQWPDQWISADTDEHFIALFLRQKRSNHTRRAYAQTLAQFVPLTGSTHLEHLRFHLAAIVGEAGVGRTRGRVPG